MRSSALRPLAVLALLSLVVPGLLGSIHEIGHEHLGSDLQPEATHSVASAECERKTSVHIEASEVVEGERCSTCVLQSKTRVLLDRRASIAGAVPSADSPASTSAGSAGQALVRLRSSRAPPRA